MKTLGICHASKHAQCVKPDRNKTTNKLRYQPFSMILSSCRLGASMSRNLLQNLSKYHVLWRSASSLDVFQHKVHNGFVTVNCSNLNPHQHFDKHFHSQNNPLQMNIFIRRCFCSESDDKPSKPKKFVISKAKEDMKEVFVSLIENKDSDDWETADWEEAENNLCNIWRGPWEAGCMQVLYEKKNLPLARSLISYLESKSSEPINRFTLTYYFALLGQHANGDEKMEKELKTILDGFMADLDLMDLTTIGVLVKGLIDSPSLYREGLKLAKICLERQEPCHTVFCDVLLASLTHNDMELLNTMLHVIDETRTDLQASITQILQACFKSGNDKGIQKVFAFMEKRKILFTESNIEDVIEVIKSLQPDRQWTAEYGNIDHKSGTCTCCGQQMSRVHVTDEEFARLREAFSDQVIIGRNIMYKSTNEELQHFQYFLRRNHKFDVVIDGLNIMRIKQHINREWLMKAVEYFAERKKKVLVLGAVFDKTIRNLSKHCQHVSPKAVVFTTHTTKADDVFYLLAAMFSGKDTLIVTRDKLRDHKCRLEPTLQNIYSMWLRKNQIYDYNFKNNKFAIGARDVFNIGPVKHGDCYHFPVDDINEESPYGNRLVLCLRGKSTGLESDPLHASNIPLDDGVEVNVLKDTEPETDEDFTKYMSDQDFADDEGVYNEDADIWHDSFDTKIDQSDKKGLGIEGDDLYYKDISEQSYPNEKPRRRKRYEQVGDQFEKNYLNEDSYDASRHYMKETPYQRERSYPRDRLRPERPLSGEKYTPVERTPHRDEESYKQNERLYHSDEEFPQKRKNNKFSYKARPGNKGRTYSYQDENPYFSKDKHYREETENSRKKRTSRKKEPWKKFFDL